MARTKKEGTTAIKKEVLKAKPASVSSETEMPDEYMAKKCKVVGTNIRYERKLRKFSIEDLAEYLELSPSYVGLLERGERCPSLKSLLKVCELFGSTPNDFLLEKRASNSKLSLAEERKSIHNNKHRTVLSVMQKLSDPELDFVISTMKSLKTMNKNAAAISGLELDSLTDSETE
ncbi:MAG: helix-turn-helix domain-containing protein [Clostridiales bacterium]|jgi:transcriptional regulator with XRE-family HTH domain|nr:helix-turn-helix domain-containing protein [Clostridiales bacterium]